MFPFDEKLTHHNLDARNHRLLDRAAGYARVLVAQVTGRRVQSTSVFCYTAPGSFPSPAVYDPRTQSVGVHTYLLENITHHLDTTQKDTLEMMLVQQLPFEDLLSIGNCADVVGALIHEHAHHQFYTEFNTQIRAHLRKHGKALVDGLNDLRVRAINEGFAYAVQEKATGFIALCEEVAQKYLNQNILIQYYIALRDSKLPLADALLDLIKQKGFPDYAPVPLLSKEACRNKNRRYLMSTQNL